MQIAKWSRRAKTTFLVVTIVLVCGEASLRLALRSKESLSVAYHAILDRFLSKKTADSKAQCTDPFDAANQCYQTYADIFSVEYDSYLGYSPVAHFTKPGVHINNGKFRYDDDLTLEKPADEIRVFVTGGSLAYGAGVSQEQLYSSQLENILAKKYPGKRIRVVNAGVGGYVSTQERILVENRVISYHPDIVVMLSGWNDVYFAYTGKDILLDQDFVKYRRKISPERPLDRFESVSLPDEKDYAFKLFFVWDLTKFLVRFDKNRMLGIMKEISLSQQKMTETLLRNIALVSDAGKRFGFKTYFYLQPTLFNTDKTLTPWEKKLLSEFEQRYPGYGAYNHEHYEVLRKVIPEQARQEGYRYIDSDLAIREESRGVFTDTVHLGDRGNRHLASFLEGHLKSDLDLISAEVATR